MNAIESKSLLTLRALRRWYDSWMGKAAPNPARPASAPVVAPVAIEPECAPALGRAAAMQTKTDARSNAQRWYDMQPKPCTIVAYTDQTTAQPVLLHALTSSAIQELFAGPSFNTPGTEWEIVNPHRLARKGSELVALLADQEFCLKQFEALLTTRFYIGDDLIKLYDRCRHHCSTAFPDAEDAPDISTEQRQQALVQLRTALVESAGTLQSLAALDESLLAACQMLGVPLPDQAIRPRQPTTLAQAA
ncbi:MAG: hypothetical protein RL748_2346 [Pseudomonadota bacterium]|jgi:hypothetical protein